MSASARLAPARSLRAVLDHSWGLLSPLERRAFRQLVVFRGGFTADAATQITGAPIALLAMLADKSLLRRSGPERYDLHELVWRYAEERLAEAPEELAEVQATHARYYGVSLRQYADQLAGDQALAVVGAISVEIENVRAGWRWAVANRQLAVVAQYQAGLSYVYEQRGWYQEATETFGSAAEQLGALADDEAPFLPEQDTVLGQVLANQGVFAIMRGQLRHGMERVERSLVRRRRAGARQEAAFALTFLGQANLFLGSFVVAQQQLEEAIAAYRQPGHNAAMPQPLIILGCVLREPGRYHEARRALDEGLAVCNTKVDRRCRPPALNALGGVHCAIGAHHEARRYLQESIAISAALDYPFAQAQALVHLGLVHAVLGEWQAASDACLASASLCREIRHEGLLVHALSTRGYVLALSGRYGEARQQCEESLARIAQPGASGREAYVWNTLGIMACGEGRHAESHSWFSAALRRALAHQARPLMLDTLVGLAGLLAEEGRGEEARRLLALVIRHPASEQPARDRAQGVLEGLRRGSIPPSITLGNPATATTCQLPALSALHCRKRRADRPQSVPRGAYQKRHQGRRRFAGTRPAACLAVGRSTDSSW